MSRSILSTAAILGALAVILGAFGAHGLKSLVPPESVSTFETGVRYHMYHVFALLATGLLSIHYPVLPMKRAAQCFLVGMLLFSGSLYLLTLLKATDTVGLSSIGLITPIGGLFLVAGWLFLFWGLLKRNT
ncbi:DUF423 domain-containing protein [Flavihumibacter sp. ZG627]|jgi:uncharacterized membrane protein YgdD (TMEM256/DUF423 family)|uniref:DUF423 domain-containing protein n=1 Tax=Flavihumibacter sp. ZG627 TaxID=1463156 RepID=UPI00057E3214|nr:DUF423 domain-containing protein [Flavihumibacter sp. ZG627]KIC89321.1 membrane protein [Flavihumibacter sp. ZG627]